MKPTLFQKIRSAFKPANQSSFGDATPEWYKSSFNREQAESFLSETEIGTFVMRKSETIQDCHVLSVKVPKYVNQTEFSHYLIVKSKPFSTQLKKKHASAYSVRGYAKEFSDLTSLVTHCSFMRDIIPVTLNLDFYREKASQEEYRRNDFFYYSSSSSSLTSTESNCDLDSINSEMC